MNEAISINVNEVVAPMANIDIDDDDSDCSSDSNSSSHDKLKNKKDANDYDDGALSLNENNKNLCESLEDLVQTFDVKVNEYYNEYKRRFRRPVRAHTCDTICDLQKWYRLTGSFEDTYNLEFNKTFSTKTKETTNLKKIDDSGYYSTFNSNDEYFDNELKEGDDDQLDRSNGNTTNNYASNDIQPLINADDVLIEIDNMMSQHDTEVINDSSSENDKNELNSTKEINDAFKNSSMSSLKTLCEYLESKIREFNEVLVQEFALRDEAEFEKETKNTFISLLHNIQNKRRVIMSTNLVNKRKKRQSLDLSYVPGIHLTTIIPYDENVKLNIQNLQILNKLLRSINDDSPLVPDLLTNYILTVICPK